MASKVSKARAALYRVIFESDTPAGRLFDVILIATIGLSVVAVMLESVASIRASYGGILHAVEWTFTVIFTLEYFLRLFSAKKPSRYAVSFFGLVDFFAILPTYVSLALAGGQYLIVIRVIRVLRIFRVLKLANYLTESKQLSQALIASRRKILVFLFTVLTLVIVIGALMFIIEGGTNGFASIPDSIYWAIVTLTTVGYGDISPVTPLGKFVASGIMILGYGIIAVPTGIVTVELSKGQTDRQLRCASCREAGHEHDARYCRHCGEALRKSGK